MPAKLQSFDDGQCQTCDVIMRDGRVVKLPTRRHEDAGDGIKKRVWYTVDWAAHGVECARCGATYDRQTGELTGDSGLIVMGERRRRTTDGKHRAFDPALDKGWRWYAAACSCVYGAWRRKTQRIRWADEVFGDDPDHTPRYLGNREWGLLKLYAGPLDTYAEAARKIPRAMGSDDDARAMDAARRRILDATGAGDDVVDHAATDGHDEAGGTLECFGDSSVQSSLTSSGGSGDDHEGGGTQGRDAGQDAQPPLAEEWER